MKILFKYKYALAIALLAAVGVACETDDYTGDSTLTPSNPTVTIEIPNPEITLLEKDSVFEFTVTLNEPQIVDIAIYIKMIAGDATEGDDFTIQSANSRVFIPAYRTSGKAIVKVNMDEVPEDTETFTLQIGDERTANATITPKTVKFTVNNVSEGELPLALSWATDFVDVAGEPVEPEDAANMILYITDLDHTVIEEVDGDGFEEFLMDETLPDGEYLIRAGIAEAIDPGDLGDPAVLDLMLTFSQLGKIAETTFTFEEAYNTAFLCEENMFTLASVVKTGSTFTVTEVGEVDEVPEIEEGTYTATLDPDMADAWFGVTDPVVRTVTVTKTAENTYQVTDVSAGGYDACCGFPIDQPAVITVDPCLGVTIKSETGAQITGQGLQLGTFDAGAGTFTVHFQDSFGSAADGADLFTTFVKD